MFSIRGSIIKGDDEKKNLMVAITPLDYEKIIHECEGLQHVFKQSSLQPIFPAWKHTNSQGITRHYCKILLSKARKTHFDSLMQNPEEKLWRLMAVPYCIENSNTGPCNGISLYYQGEYVAPKKFRVKQTQLSEQSNVQESVDSNQTFYN